MNDKRIAIACQGGGSQCAFVAGALATMFAADVHRRFRIVGLSGTSGGAITAALAWFGLLEQAHGDERSIEDRILACWSDLSAQTPQEIMLDEMCVSYVRMYESGKIPGMAISPSSMPFQLWARLSASLIARPEFTDLRALLVKHMDLEGASSRLAPDSPVLLIGAADVLEGTFKTFSSVCGEIGVDALLASAAIPNLFPAVWVDGHAYWDGIFSSNPPITAFVRKALMGRAVMPNEIWIIRVNPLSAANVPEKPCDISDRRNAMAGNLSLQHELKMIDIANHVIQENAFSDRFRAKIGLDATEPIAVRVISMSDELLQTLDYPSKLSRHPDHIGRLIADGQAQARSFLTNVERAERVV